MTSEHPNVIRLDSTRATETARRQAQRRADQHAAHQADTAPTHPPASPCPDWCHRAAHHPYQHGAEEDTSAGHYHRLHNAHLAAHRPTGLTVWLHQLDTTEHPSQPGTLRPSRVSIDLPGSTADLGDASAAIQALQALADDLHAAAGRLAAVATTGGPQ